MNGLAIRTLDISILSARIHLSEPPMVFGRHRLWRQPLLLTLVLKHLNPFESFAEGSNHGFELPRDSLRLPSSHVGPSRLSCRLGNDDIGLIVLACRRWPPLELHGLVVQTRSGRLVPADDWGRGVTVGPAVRVLLHGASSIRNNTPGLRVAVACNIGASMLHTKTREISPVRKALAFRCIPIIKSLRRNQRYRLRSDTAVTRVCSHESRAHIDTCLLEDFSLVPIHWVSI